MRAQEYWGEEGGRWCLGTMAEVWEALQTAKIYDYLLVGVTAPGHVEEASENQSVNVTIQYRLMVVYTVWERG